MSSQKRKTRKPFLGVRGLTLMVPAKGFEPSQYCYQWILSPSRLPFRQAGK